MYIPTVSMSSPGTYTKPTAETVHSPLGGGHISAKDVLLFLATGLGEDMKILGRQRDSHRTTGSRIALTPAQSHPQDKEITLLFLFSCESLCSHCFGTVFAKRVQSYFT